MNRKTAAVISASLGTALLVAGCGTVNQAASHSKVSTGNQTATNSTGTATGQAGQTPQAQTQFPLTVKDQAGHTITIKKAPKHIASITLGTDTILSGLVPKSEIAMVTKFSADPNQSNIVSFVKGIPKINQANSEQIIAAHPDLVLAASYTQSGVVQQLKQAGIPTYEFASFNSQKAIEKNIKIMGKLVDKPAKANQLIKTMNQQLKQIGNAVKGMKKPTVISDSSYGDAAGSQTTVNDMIRDAGGVNAAAGVTGWKKVTDEQIVKWNPDVMIISSTDKGYKQKLLHDKALQDVNFVKNRRIYAVPPADLNSLSQYFPRGVRDIAKDLHPKANIPKLTK
ncbi:ABC transporter substrate-binding protein [Alicyclobacillus sp. SO9]|uniref:ABC transporter substrate-binding protein n=1 Tax=Alicyclobacillus sp. SO9 TaxID=2665646 RepID=UPI0018E71CF5|nr:ABC transporter substrate-binding protein [Alicyclobacillus sp. SO9]QQE79942.1 ABC transporter substrate-binding protein [Alicyclobacillus sp. SO9]